MPDEGTAAVLERDDAATQADNADDESTEAVADGLATESETGEDSTDSDTEGEEPDEVAKAVAKAVKDTEAKLKESFRQQRVTAERAAADKALEESFMQQLQQAETVVAQEGYQSLQWVAGIIGKMHDEGQQVDPRWIDKQLADISNTMARANAVREMNAHYDLLVKNLGDYKPPADDLAAFERAKRSNNLRAAHDALRVLYKGRGVAEAKAELAADAKAAAVNAKGKDAPKTPTPTTGGASSGRSTRRFTTMLAADTAFSKGEISLAEVRQYVALEKAGKLPYS